MRSDLSFCLLQIRAASDPVRAEEVDCFVRRLEVDPGQVVALDVLAESLDDSIYERFDAVLVGGSGEFSVLDDVPPIQRLLDFLGETAARGFPTFASCFGFQAMSLALGGEVVHDGERAEVGTFDIGLTPDAGSDEIFGGLPERFLAQQGHKDHVTRLPTGARHLASSERSPFQAARFGEGLVWATQFHPELTEDDNRRRVMRYHELYADEIDAVLEILRPSHETHGLLARFADVLGDASGKRSG
ncbi:GMP synthase [Enhygromyxa salina]|uniref:GMP synthase n=1 Tax=Enhygromyxa salina TaxID=215803 RepID=A0A2S9XBG9_9BACT|nr:type 1 glutamine amidotransferase [Enhygromyxa salina]PRP90207.1 GMP synthase [Enhygromyxa salina]